MKRALLLFVLSLLFSGCAIAYSEGTAPTPVVNVIPPGEPGGPPVPTIVLGGTKVVEMVTDTPTVSAASPTKTPIVSAMATRTPFGTNPPASLAERGIPAATFQDAVSGFAFDYPDGWILTDLSDAQKQNAAVYSISLRSFTPTVGPKQQDGPVPGLTALDVTVFVKGGPKTLAQAIDERRTSIKTPESGQPVVIVKEEEWTLKNALPAHYFLINAGPVNPGGPDRMIVEMVTMVQGRMVLVSGWGDNTLVNAVTISMREGE